MLRSKYKGFDVNSQYMPLGILVYKVLDSLSPDSDQDQACKMVDFFIAHQATRDKYSLRQSAHMLAHTYMFMKHEHPKVAEMLLQQSLSSHNRTATHQKLFTESFVSDYGHQELGHSPFHQDLLGSFESDKQMGEWLKTNMKPSALASLTRQESFSQFKSLLKQSDRKKFLSEQLGL
ncbi:hypothetical protein P5704_024905 (plasmid) [Pseudomonas sp. FeN3W]|nr:hypothetical protein P5704_024905 [Pseudomonas sp. FeN3W]